MNNFTWQKAEKIIFTSDILRPYRKSTTEWESAVLKNVRWLEHLIGWQIAKASTLQQKKVCWEPGGFDAHKIYESLGLPINYQSWASIFYTNNLPEDIVSQVTLPFIGSCIIGVELPDFLQHALTQKGIPFIDIVSHPVRFMSDLLFAFRTNHPAVHARLQLYQVRLDDACIPQANLLKAKASWMPTLSLPKKTALITGQVATDKAVIDRKTGKFLNLGNFTENLFQICAEHPLVLFKPHPYQDAQCPSRRTIEQFKSIKFVTQNFYYLIAQENLTDVYAINSGTVSEAPYFGKCGHTLSTPLYEFDGHAPTLQTMGACIPINTLFLEPIFWADVLSPLMKVQTQLPKGPAARPSLLRRSLNADWDYGFIDQIVQHDVMEKITC
jgi:hypothetical protein